MYEVRSEEEQRTAYRDGYRGGELARKARLTPSQYTLSSVLDFPLGSWSRQHAEGYYDGLHGLPPVCVVVPGPGPARGPAPDRSAPYKVIRAFRENSPSHYLIFKGAKVFKGTPIASCEQEEHAKLIVEALNSRERKVRS